MKKNHTVRTFLAGALTALLVVSVVPSALAAAGKTITIWPGVSVYIDDQKLDPRDANGKPVEVFTYNGTTYLPVRAVSEALGKPVQWDGKTKSVYVGKHSGDSPAAWLSQMDYFSGTKSITTAASEKDNAGNTHYYCVTRDFDRTYKLNGQYTRMTGVLYQSYEYRSSSISKGYGLTIYGDGRILYDNAAQNNLSQGGFEPDLINIDLTGVLELRVHLHGGGYRLSVGDMGLWT